MTRLTKTAAAAALAALIAAAASPARADATVTWTTDHNVTGHYTAEMVFIAWGCFGMYKGFAKVCAHKPLATKKGSQVSYHWPAGTSGRRVQPYIVCGNDNRFYPNYASSDNSSNHKATLDGSKYFSIDGQHGTTSCVLDDRYAIP